MKKVLLVGPVRHNGVTYKPGEWLKGLTDEQAARLIAVGSASEAVDDNGELGGAPATPFAGFSQEQVDALLKAERQKWEAEAEEKRKRDQTPDVLTRDFLEELSLAKLKALAKERQISGYTNMEHGELVDALLQHQDGRV